MGQGRVRPVFTALLPPGIVVVGRRRHRLRAPSSAAPGGSMAANPEHTAPAPCPRKKARSLSPARLALRGRRDSRNSGCWRPTAVARGGRGLLSPWGSCFATARGRYHLFPGGGRGVARLDERPGFGIAFLAAVETLAEGERRARIARTTQGRGPLAPAPQAVEKVACATFSRFS